MLYVIADTHLSFSVEKPMDVFGLHWKDHFDRIRQDWLEKVEPEDAVLIPGDISWAMHLEEALGDLHEIGALPGRCVLIRGNHDYWWTTAAKMRAHFERLGIGSIEILHNNCCLYEDIAL